MGLTEVQVTFAWVPSMLKVPVYCDPGYTLFVMVKLQLGAVCRTVQVAPVTTCNPTGQLVLTISVVTLYVPAKFGQLSAGLLLLVPPHATTNTEHAIPASTLAITLVPFLSMVCWPPAVLPDSKEWSIRDQHHHALRHLR